MDEEIKLLLDTYIEQIEAREATLIAFKKLVGEITYSAEKEMGEVLEKLEHSFEANEISEEEYLDSMRKEKASILEKTRSKLNSLIASQEKQVETV